MERLEDSVKIMGFEVPFSTEELMQGAIDACKANHFEECYVRPLAYIGDGPLGVFPGANTWITTSGAPKPLTESQRNRSPVPLMEEKR